MPYYKEHTKEYLKKVMDLLKDKRYTKIDSLSSTAWITAEPVSFAKRRSGKMREVKIGDRWGELWDCAWFHFNGKVPEYAAGRKVVMIIDLSGEACVYDEDGIPTRGLTTASSSFDFSLGEPGKTVVQLLEKAVGGEKIDIWLDAGNNDLFGKYRNNGILKIASIAVCNESIRQLYYDFKVLYELMDNLPGNTARHQSILYTLKQAANLLSKYNDQEVQDARKILKSELDKKCGDPSLTVSALGHAHIDLAWLWPIRETIRKGARTFSTALQLMEEYPEYVFGASQPQLYQWMKEYYPELYRKIKEKVKEERWEVQGAMWVEADTNISGGEALIRQILYGKRFFQEEFYKDVETLWLPDVFGYSAALPQILKKSGVNYFMTQKLSWSEHNDFPHHTFCWEGIDGSSILTHMLPEETYNSSGSPEAILKAEHNFHDKGISDHCLILYGIGDGGGGPGAEHLEILKREKNLNGLSPVVQEKSIDFFKKTEKNIAKYKRWSGELYLEKHQGTFTTQAKNKKYNRMMEIALRELEYAAVLGMLYSDYKYPQDRIEKIWKEVLLYQFHDILPGSSIKRVHEEAIERYEEIYRETKCLIDEAFNTFIDSDDRKSFQVYNTLSWDRQEWVKIDKDWHNIEIPAFSSTTVSKEKISTLKNDPEDEVKVNDDILENNILKLRFNKDGTIVSIFDKENLREVIACDESGNRLVVYEDDGDAWDISIYYDEKKPEAFKLISVESFIDGPKAVIRHIYKLGNSTLEQEISLITGSRRIDFKTKVDWKEKHKMLRTLFPVNVFAREARCGIQFGSIKRPTHSNTTWDMAKFEVPAQKWVDISQRDYGVALLNDCKYGYKVKENCLNLNLLRSPEYPGKDADRGVHEFIYSLYPHSGDHVDGKVAHQAYELNIPVKVLPGSVAKNINPLVKPVEENIIVESIKKAEDDDTIIVRLYENCGMETNCQLILNEKINRVSITNLMEKEIEEMSLQKGAILLEFAPYEINTLKLCYK